MDNNNIGLHTLMDHHDYIFIRYKNSNSVRNIVGSKGFHQY